MQAQGPFESKLLPSWGTAQGRQVIVLIQCYLIHVLIKLSYQAVTSRVAFSPGYLAK